LRRAHKIGKIRLGERYGKSDDKWCDHRAPRIHKWERETIAMAVGRSETTDTDKAVWLAKKELLVEWVLPGLFVLILLGCLAHLGYCAIHGAWLPTAGFQYATSAFAS